MHIKKLIGCCGSGRSGFNRCRHECTIP